MSSEPQAQVNDEAKTRRQLVQLKSEIARLSKELRSDLSRRSSLRDALRKSELTIAQLRRDIERTQLALSESREELTSLQQQRDALLVARGRQQERIAVEIQTAYQMGKQAQLRVLLNQEDPATLARAMTYYDYFYQARLDAIRGYLETVATLDELAPDIEAAQAELESNRQSLDSQREKLVASQQQRQKDLRQLNAAIETKDQRLQKLAEDETELQRLLDVIEEAIVDLAVPESYQAFADARGAMPWPISGKARNRFGGRRGQGSLRWQGLEIPARPGSPVQAIHHGRVVFADWFRGSGLLLIIDHGDGFMSLYAHNETLLREVGEWVTAGADIATVGRSGGRDETALYFEIRRDGKPTNPTPWLR
ncbi:MAG: peptidoglycan DD-metalloendopeptidase family protein [Pseudomonadota bacterium]